jgi:hypothetical protein
MAKTASSTVKLSVVGELADALDLGMATFAPNYSATFGLTNGTGANQINQLFADTRTLAASATENIDLAGGLTDPFGTAITFTKIKALIIRAKSTNTNDVVVGGHATAACASFFGDATDKVKVKPGGVVAFVAPDANGYAVTATTADLLTIANSAAGTGVTYDIFLLGTV